MGDKTEEDSEVERLIQMRENLLAELDNASEGGSLSSSSAAQESAKNTTETLLNVLPERVSPNSSQYNSQSVNEAVENISFIVNNEKTGINGDVPEGYAMEDYGDSSDQSIYDDEGNVDTFKNLEEIDELLEKPVEDVPDHLKNASKRFKRVLQYRGADHFDVLPDGWIEVAHSSGLPVYLHKKSRCCTFSRPYFLGPGSVRLHRVPESAIPCYFQRKLYAETEKLTEEKKSVEVDRNAVTSSSSPPRNEILDKLNAPEIKIKTGNDIVNAQLTPDALYEYAKKCFKFKNICVYRFPRWADARSYYKNKKRATAQQVPFIPTQEGPPSAQRPGLPDNVVLITVPSIDHATKPQQKGFYLNPQGKTSVSVLHELMQKILKCNVTYSFNETRNSTTPYHCVARLEVKSATNKLITASSIKEKLMCLKEKYRIQEEQMQGNNPSNDKKESEYITLGEGTGSSKKHAKLMAAKKAVEDLFGGVEFDNDGMAILPKQNKTCADEAEMKITESHNHQHMPASKVDGDAIGIFDQLGICDSRVPELCSRAGQPAPYLILQEYLKRHAAFGDTEISFQTKRLHCKKHKFDLTVGKHTVSVNCSNKREGKQKAAQLMLSKFLPNIQKWGDILRLYGYEAQQKQKEAKKNKESIIKLQEEVRNQNERDGGVEPNTVILDKLKSEMLKLSSNMIEKAAIIKEPTTSGVTVPRPPLPPPIEALSPDGHQNSNRGNAHYRNHWKRGGVCPLKRARLDNAEYEQLKRLLEAAQRLQRSSEISFSDLPLLDESQLRELSGKLDALFPNSAVHVPTLF